MGEGNKLVDINQASLEELSIVPGLSTSLAEKVIASRPFENVNDLTRVRGIGPKSLLPMLPYLVVNALNEEQEPQTVQPPAIPSVITFDPVVGKTGKINQPPTEVDGSFSSQVRANNNTDNPQILEPSMVPISGVIPGSTNLLVFPGALNRHMDGPANNDESSGQTALPRSSNSTTSGTRANWSGGLNIESISLIIGTGILALILGIVFTLGILRVHNGTLSYASSSNYMALQVKLETITGQVNTLQQDLDSLRTRMDALQALSGRVGDVENKTLAIEEDIKSSQEALKALQEQNSQMKEQMTQLQEKTSVFQRFLDGMKSLLSGLNPTTP